MVRECVSQLAFQEPRGSVKGEGKSQLLHAKRVSRVWNMSTPTWKLLFLLFFY